jgi:DNA topoisomerase-1
MTSIERLHATGILRLGSPKSGFRYRAARGRRPSGGEIDRIRRLRLPPAWVEVAVQRSPGAKLQAVGKDKAGRWQYRYGPSAVREREDKKFHRLLSFARALPRMREAVARDLRRPGLQRERVLACIVRILSTCFLRPGSRVYARENGSYGLVTLRVRHVRVTGDLLHMDFPGKSHQRQVRELRDRQVARVLRALIAREPSGFLFEYADDEGVRVTIRRGHVNSYIREVMGGRFSAKDFRTCAGTLLCAGALARTEVAPDAAMATRKRLVAQAVKHTAAHLGNTPAVCRASYVAPAVLSAFERGHVVERFFASVEEMADASRALSLGCERALLRLLHSAQSIRIQSITSVYVVRAGRSGSSSTRRCVSQ